MDRKVNTLGKRVAALGLTLGLTIGMFIPSSGVLHADELAGSDLSASVDAGAPEVIGLDDSVESSSDVLSDVISAISSSSASSFGDASESSSESQVFDDSSSVSVSSSASAVSESTVSSDVASESNAVSMPAESNADSSVDDAQSSSVDTAVSDSVAVSESSSVSNVESESSVETESGETASDILPESDILSVLAPLPGTDVTASVGDELTLSSGVDRDDVAVSYQWQRMQLAMPEKEPVEVEQLFDAGEGSSSLYMYVVSDMTERELLAVNPEATWSGIELYFAAQDALSAIGEDIPDLTFAWHTPNYALDGYAISAERVDDVVYIYADKDDKRFVASPNADGAYEFASASTEYSVEDVTTDVWVDVEGATGNSYTFTVTGDDLYADYRLVITIQDEEYLANVRAVLEGEGVTLSEEQLAADQILYSPTIHVSGETVVDGVAPEDTQSGLNFMASMFSAVSTPKLSADGRWIEGLNSSYEYITKDTYDRVTAWYKNKEISPDQYKLYWTKLGKKGSGSYNEANVLDENGRPTGATRVYMGFNLVEGNKLEVASEWYGKTVLFRPVNTNNIVEIKIPAYTEIYGAGDKYEESSAGSTYKKNIVFLNPYVKDADAMYHSYISSITDADGWVMSSSGQRMDIHITSRSVNVESFNADPQKYMVDAEGNYRVDAVGWGVCVYAEPDLSGKAYWTLKDFIANGYGFLTGHDTMYAYAGTYYDAYGYDLDESSIDPNDGTTWYYDINSWQPTATDVSGTQTSTTRGGHFYMNELMGTNAGNVYSGTVDPSDAPSKILSTGGSNGRYGKQVVFGTETLNVVQTGYSAQQAASNPRYRTPTNYPFFYGSGTHLPVKYTHSNQQAAFGPVWVNYYGQNKDYTDKGFYADPMTWYLDGLTGTNNFYLSGDGNYLMNQAGHLPYNLVSGAEARLFINSIMYVSQRKQCEICAANQGHQTSHFVRRVSVSNADAVLKALQQGGTYWYPIDGCYQLVDDIQLPDDWTPIAGFKGHWNSDVYDVTLGANGQPLLKNDSADGESGWNLGTTREQGTVNVFNSAGVRTTGVARVVGDLNDLFGTSGVNYTGYVVKIFGSDNPSYMGRSEVYACTVNTDSKYVISNLPCVYNSDAKTGVLTAHVYDTNGGEVKEYGRIRVNVSESFWNTDMTTPLYLGMATAEPVKDYVTYEGAQGIFSAHATSSDNFTVARWEYSADGGQTWTAVPSTMGTFTNKVTPPSGEMVDYSTTSVLTLSYANAKWNGYLYRAVFSGAHGEWNSYQYYRRGGLVSNTPVANYVPVIVHESGYDGHLTVKSWPVFAKQAVNQTTYESKDAVFTAYGFALADGTAISVRWQYSSVFGVGASGGAMYDWHYLDADDKFSTSVKPPVRSWNVSNRSMVDNTALNAVDAALQKVAPDNDLNLFHSKAPFTGVESKLTINSLDIEHNNIYLRAEFKAVTKSGTSYTWYSDVANGVTGAFSQQEAVGGLFSNFRNSKDAERTGLLKVLSPMVDVNSIEAVYNRDELTGDPYGQYVRISDVSRNVFESSKDGGHAVTYSADIYYKPGEMPPSIVWQYMRYLDRTPRTWSANVVPGISSSVTNTSPVLVTTAGDPYNGWYKVTSTLTLDHIPLSMYNVEKLEKYYFRCLALTEYATMKTQPGTKNVAAVGEWGGLMIDYKIAIRHNGVIEYGIENTINGSKVTTPEGVRDATSNRDVSKWKYPKLSIDVPGKGTGSEQHINTVIVRVGNEHASDSLSLGSIPTGIEVVTKTNKMIVLHSGDAYVNKVSAATWESCLRDITFNTYNPNVNFSDQNVVNGTVGGTNVEWYIDENRVGSAWYDSATGHLYQYVASDDITYNAAVTNAQGYNLGFGLVGRLWNISDSGEYNRVKDGLGLTGKNVWIANAAVPGGMSSNGHGWHNAVQGWFVDGNGRVGQAPILVDYSGEKSVTLISNVSGTTSEYLGASSPHNRWGDPGWLSSGLPIGVAAARDLTIPSSIAPAGATVTLKSIKIDTQAMFNGPAAAGSYNDVGQWVPGTNMNVWLGLSKYNAGVESMVWGMSAGDYQGAWYDNSQTHHVVHETTLGNVTYVSEGADKAVGRVFFGIANGATAMLGGGTIISGTVTGTFDVDYEVTDNPVNGYVIEYDPAGLSFAVTNHSALDDARIGTKASYVPSNGGVVSVVIEGDSKVYDGTEIYPSSFKVTGSKGVNLDLFEVTYKITDNVEHADYGPPRTVSGVNYTDTNAVNAGTYHVRVQLKPEYMDTWTLDSNSVTECDLVIVPRPVDVYSRHNDKIYDGLSQGDIRDIQFVPGGVIPGDTVMLTSQTAVGAYVDQNGSAAIHNSKYNNSDNEYSMIRDALKSPLGIKHDSTSDPHYNYVLGNETYTGAIDQRGLDIHSIYLEDADFPRNIKAYDGTDIAVVSDILIDNIVKGDAVALSKDSLNGTYATSDAGESLDENGKVLPDRFLKLEENVITLTETPQLINNDYKDYFIASEAYSGAIYRASLEAIVDDHRYVYGDKGPGYPVWDTEYSFGVVNQPWLHIDGLVSGDVLTLDDKFSLVSNDKDGNPIEFTNTTDVGEYPVSVEGLNETNYPLLENYIVSIKEGVVEVYPREIAVTAESTDWYAPDLEGIPVLHASFAMKDDTTDRDGDGDVTNYLPIGDDLVSEYADMSLVNDDTIASVLLSGGAPVRKDASIQLLTLLDGDNEDLRRTVMSNGSTIVYNTEWYLGAPALFLDIKNDPSVYPCEWCEDYHGFELGTDHWHIDGYRLSINQDTDDGDTLDIVTVENPLGETVKNYKLVYIDGLVRQHPELRFQLEATVPMQVCMYGYAGDGEVVEPTEYGITNYSNGMIEITDIDVSDDGWSIVDKPLQDLLRGEMSMKLMDTQVVVGNNKPRNPDRWVIDADHSEDSSGVEMLIPMTCFIAGGNVNKRQESYVTHVTYTIAEHGLTVPSSPGFDVPDHIDGEPVVVDPNT